MTAASPRSFEPAPPPPPDGKTPPKPRSEKSDKPDSAAIEAEFGSTAPKEREERLDCKLSPSIGDGGEPLSTARPTPSAANLDYDPLEAAITVLGNVKIENPSSRMDTEDAHNRVNLALEYLRLEKERRDA